MQLKNKIIIGCLVFALIAPASFISAQSGTPEEKTQLEQQLQEIEAQIAEYQNELNTISGEKNTLQNKIKQLKNQQASINLQIKASNLQISDLENRISSTKIYIADNEAKSVELQEQISQTVRKIREYDSYPLFYLLITKNSWSEALDEIKNYIEITANLGSLIDEAGKTKEQLDSRMQILGQAQDEAENLLSIRTLQRQQLAGSVNEQNILLQETKGRESDYQAALNDKKKRAAEIRNRLYGLLDVTTQITFGEAVKIAEWASAQTGVRAAFLLAILTQESNLGKNIGTCNRAGDPPEKSWKVIMKPDRDQVPFQQITSDLGLNTDTTPVSCPMRDSKGNQMGWGGAMGPAQFIPSTWMGYKDKVAAITGKTANPWDIRDAFIASAIKLKAGGAGTKAGEWAAAMRYFSGSTNVKYRFYGDNVVKLAEQYQKDIDDLEN